MFMTYGAQDALRQPDISKRALHINPSAGSSRSIQGPGLPLRKLVDGAAQHRLRLSTARVAGLVRSFQSRLFLPKAGSPLRAAAGIGDFVVDIQTHGGDFSLRLTDSRKRKGGSRKARRTHKNEYKREITPTSPRLFVGKLQTFDGTVFASALHVVRYQANFIKQLNV
jgi:hypothetical protein